MPCATLLAELNTIVGQRYAITDLDGIISVIGRALFAFSISLEEVIAALLSDEDSLVRHMFSSLPHRVDPAIASICLTHLSMILLMLTRKIQLANQALIKCIGSCSNASAYS
ncbi:hypothetical protein N182_27995 [Sinorhizobium sp. GL2]|nr:hypothetical protein N182_27995 [Sinorhizobium sp. GL2]